MSSNSIKIVILFIVCMLLQLLIFNNLQISGFINPYAYILVILTLPFGLSTPLTMVVALVSGLTIDLFCNTPGMHAFACVLIGYLRQYVLKFIAFREEYKSDSLPSMNTYGLIWYAKYAAIMVVIHHFALFFIEQFDSLFFWPTLLRIILSSIVTIIFLLVAQFFIPRDGAASID
ncbi:MAG: rod shape-determining protein MreD [Bacteroidales bacterium]|nr:rod shape-determining protein MreD [Bacteroidales bacterium]